MPADSGLRRFLSSSLSICRTLNLREKSFTVPRSQETATAGSVAASVLISLRRNFLPIKFSCPTFRRSGPGSSTRSIPSARHSSTVFPINKTAGRGQEDFIGRKIFQAADRRDYKLENAVFPPVADKSRFCGWGCILTISVNHARGDLSLRTLPLTESRADTDALLGGDDVDIRGVLVLVPGFPS